MFHSDRGSQYTAFAFRKLLDELNVLQSFSKKGYPFDNACCESFFKYLKKEETNRRNFRTYRDLYHSVFQYIEGFYNSRRPHGSLGYLTPDEMEATFRDRQVIYPFPENIFKNCFIGPLSAFLFRIQALFCRLAGNERQKTNMYVGNKAKVQKEKTRKTTAHRHFPGFSMVGPAGFEPAQ